MTEEEYYKWFRECGFERTGNGTDLTEEMINDRGAVIQVPRASTLSPEDRREAAEGMSRFFKWKPEWGAH